MRAPGAVGGALLGAVCLLPAPARAQPPAVLSGLLTITLAPVAATLTTSAATSTGTLGTTSVVDGRSGAGGYDISVSSSGFDLVGPAVTASPTTHIPPSAAAVRVSAATGGTASTTAAKPLPAAPLCHLTYAGTVLVVDAISTYTLAMTVTIPAAAAAGRYTGTVTQTIV